MEQSSPSNNSFQGYSTSELCAECGTFDLEEFKNLGSSPDHVTRTRQIAQGSACPGCRFFYAELHACEVPPTVPETYAIDVMWFSRPWNLRQFISIKPAGPLSIEVSSGFLYHSQLRYILPLTRLSQGIEAEEEKYRLYSQESPYGIPFRPVRTNQIRVAMLKKWLMDCQIQHSEQCSQPNEETLSSIKASPGFRVIDCQERSIIVPPSSFQYVALSYVWGQPRAKVPGTSSAGKATSVLPSTLPRTIEDAITMTVKLGFRFLWVDKHCIDQRTDEHSLLMQLSMMDKIYSGAMLTLVAAAGSDAEIWSPGRWKTSNRTSIDHRWWADIRCRKSRHASTRSRFHVDHKMMDRSRSKLLTPDSVLQRGTGSFRLWYLQAV